MNLQRV